VSFLGERAGTPSADHVPEDWAGIVKPVPDLGESSLKLPDEILSNAARSAVDDALHAAGGRSNERVHLPERGRKHMRWPRAE
jgi:hypothetical protein